MSSRVRTLEKLKLDFFCRGEGEVSQERVWWIDNMKYWVEGVAVLILCLAGILGEIILPI